jgi:flagellar secretion chaperone FliS
MSFSTEYLETKVLTATPHQLHLLVIDGAIRHATSAEAALLAGDFARAEAQLERSNQCVSELMAGLKSNRQPQLVEQLKAVFVFVQRSLGQAQLRHDPARLADALPVLRLHRETWLALGKKLAQESAADVPAEAGSGYSWSS